MKKTVISAVLLFAASLIARGQELSLSTNIADIARAGAANAEASYGFARHWSVNAGAKYDSGGYERQQLYSLGARFWPWHIYSGWWIAGKMQYQEFNDADRITLRTSEGDRYGAGLSAGYAKMLSRHLNMDIGVGFWSGVSRFTTYSCPSCGRILDSGSKSFVLPNDLMMSLSWIF